MKEWHPFRQMPQPLQITVTGDAATLDAVEAAVEEEVFTITRLLDSVEAQQRDIARVRQPQVSRLSLLLDAAQRELVLGMIAQVAPGAEVHEAKLAEIDWVSKVQKDFPPFTMGPFYVHGSHGTQGAPPNHFPLLIDAAAAFGTGEHATTAGCLLALAREKKKRRLTRSVLDVGCGTAILAIGAARLWKGARIAACDNDPVAVKVSAHNLRVNRVAGRAHAFVSDGYRMRPLRGKQYPVIVANILARPLMRMAWQASQHLAPGGTLILSGLLNNQEAMVLSAHRAQGRYLKQRLRRGNWSVLVLK